MFKVAIALALLIACPAFAEIDAPVMCGESFVTLHHFDGGDFEAGTVLTIPKSDILRIYHLRDSEGTHYAMVLIRGLQEHDELQVVNVYGQKSVNDLVLCI